MQVINTRCFGRFWPVSWRITHQFGVPERFLWLPKPKVCLRVVHQHSPFWPILARFMGYYSLIWGFGAILWLLNPNVCLRVGHLHSQFLLILARFMEY